MQARCGQQPGSLCTWPNQFHASLNLILAGWLAGSLRNNVRLSFHINVSYLADRSLRRTINVLLPADDDCGRPTSYAPLCVCVRLAAIGLTWEGGLPI